MGFLSVWSMDSSILNKVLLEKFELDPDELDKANELVEKHVAKIQRIADFDQLKLEMKVHKKSVGYSFEIKGKLFFPGHMVGSESRDENPFVAIDSVLKKIITEFEHKIRKWQTKKA